MIEFFVHLSRFFVDADCIEFISIVLYLLLRNRELALIVPLFAFTRLFNVVLKNLIAIPLPDNIVPSYGLHGFAFPSGHVHICSILYVWIIWRCKTLPLKLISVLPLLVGMVSEVISGFHYVSDVIVAPFIAFSECWSVYKFRYTYIGKLFLLLIGCSALMVMIIFACEMNGYTNSNPYVFDIFYKMCGFCLSHLLMKHTGFNKGVAIIGVIGAVSLITVASPYVCVNQLKWMFLGSLIPVAKQAILMLLSMIKFSKSRFDNGVAFSMMFTRPKLFQVFDM